MCFQLFNYLFSLIWFCVTVGGHGEYEIVVCDIHFEADGNVFTLPLLSVKLDTLHLICGSLCYTLRHNDTNILRAAVGPKMI